MLQQPDFPCDADLAPLVNSGQLDEWQAMQITTARDAARARDGIEVLQKKTDALRDAISKMATPEKDSQLPTIRPVPSYRNG